MTRGLKILCARCHGEVSLVLGFSAPMTMPGHEEPKHDYHVQLINPVDDDNKSGPQNTVSSSSTEVTDSDPLNPSPLRTENKSLKINILSTLGLVHIESDRSRRSSSSENPRE
jgi:hypothetical protein